MMLKTSSQEKELQPLREVPSSYSTNWLLGYSYPWKLSSQTRNWHRSRPNGWSKNNILED